MSFTVYPAIDVREGRVVRLRQGDYAQEIRYAADPFELAADYAAQGARWLHLVDLDAAKSGGYTLLPLLARLRRETGLRVQTGGGVRSAEDVQRLLDGGAERVVVGSLAITDTDHVAQWIERFGSERIVVALDARQVDGVWQLPTHGWTQASSLSLEQALAFYAARGLRHLLSTDIARDGMLAGPNLALYRLIAERAPGVRVQASGGARELADIAAAAASGAAGIVLGRALLEGRLDLRAALAAVSSASAVAS